MMTSKIVIIAGPTASGKSARAQALAAEQNGVIINADSMQMYQPLQILTARPTAEEEAATPHRLYGVLSGQEACSAGKWLELACAAINETHAAGKLPIVTGGTGLYIKTLMQGISPIPAVPDEVKGKMRQWNSEQLRATLLQRDPTMANRLKPTDRQRMVRALEVLEATGKSLAYWQTLPPAPPYPAAAFETIIVTLSREELYARCDTRFMLMLEQGVTHEVQKLLALELSDDLPVMRAVGVPEIRGFLGGEYGQERMIDKAQQATRNYAKRQLTWIRNQMS